MHGSVAWLAQRPLLVAHGTSSKVRFCFYPWERLTTEPANRIELVRCTVSYRTFSRKRAQMATRQPAWAKAREARLTTAGATVWLAAG